MDTWKFEFIVECVDEMGEVIHTYTSIEADTEEDAKAVTEEFCRDDFPDRAFSKAVIKEAIELAELEHMAEIAEYERISAVNPYCI